jgi:asparagine synthase (glutamine-hydrolysing)
MCGIFSYIKNSENLSEKEIDFSRKKTNELKHRGPDHYGEWINKNIFLGVQRLAINDLSASGNQPFYFEDKVMIFNGEVYNHIEKRKILEEKGYKFKSNSDTEVFFYFVIEYGFKNLDKIMECSLLFILMEKKSILEMIFFQRKRCFIILINLKS